MSDAEAPIFPRERRPKRKAFPVFPVVAGVVVLIVAAGFGGKMWLDQGERQAYAQAQQIGQAYFSALKADAGRFEEEMGDIDLQRPTKGMDFAWNRGQIDRLHAIVARYRALGAQRAKTAHDAMAALKIRPDLRKRYLAESDRTLADKRALLEQRLGIQDRILTSTQAQYDTLAGRPGGWQSNGYGMVLAGNATYQALEAQSELKRKLVRDDDATKTALLAPEMWVSAPP